jgi:hypothetical protein
LIRPRWLVVAGAVHASFTDLALLGARQQPAAEPSAEG